MTALKEKDRRAMKTRWNLSGTLLIAGLLLFLGGCGGSTTSRYKKTSVSKAGVFHIVQKGHTVYRIARTYGVDPKVLLRINRISNPRDIKVGERIFVPGVRHRRQVATHVPTPPKKQKKPKSKGAPVIKYGNTKNVKVKNGYFAWPVKGKITSKFGLRKGRSHDGLDISGKKGSPILAAASGKVVFSDWGPTGYGKMVVIKHSEHLMSIYAHNQKNLVSKNASVKKGEKIALLGQTGRATGPHLHLEFRMNRTPVNPQKYLP